MEQEEEKLWTLGKHDGKKRIIFDKHVQTVFGERESKKRSHMTQDEPVKNHLRSSLYAQVAMADLYSP